MPFTPKQLVARHAGDVGKNSAGDGDLPLFRMEFQHNWITFLSGQTGKPPSGHSYQAIIIYDFSQKYKSKNAIKTPLGPTGQKNRKKRPPTGRRFLLFQRFAVVQHGRAVEEQHILVIKRQVFSYLAGRQITDIRQRHPGVAGNEQRGKGACQRIPEDYQLPVRFCMGIFHG